VQGFYPGGTAIAFRQATNWASRQGFTEAVRERMKVWRYGDSKAKLSVSEEALSGIVVVQKDPKTVALTSGHPTGTLACWNHPFEVARIEMQAAVSPPHPLHPLCKRPRPCPCLADD
jgi:hypothetical protein